MANPYVNAYGVPIQNGYAPQYGYVPQYVQPPVIPAQQVNQSGQTVQTNQPVQTNQQYQNQTWQQPRQQIVYPQGIPWVTRLEAENYNPPPGPATALWVQEEKLIYLKSLDNLGKPVTQILRYTDAPEPAQNAPVSVTNEQPAYALKSDLDALHGDLDALRDKIQPVITMMEKQAEKSRRKGDSDG